MKYENKCATRPVSSRAAEISISLSRGARRAARGARRGGSGSRAGPFQGRPRKQKKAVVEAHSHDTRLQVR
jgi:hypothetical protein